MVSYHLDVHSGFMMTVLSRARRAKLFSRHQGHFDTVAEAGAEGLFELRLAEEQELHSIDSWAGGIGGIWWLVGCGAGGWLVVGLVAGGWLWWSDTN